MRIAILSANLNNFDRPIPPVTQQVAEDIIVDFHCFTDEDFPPITGLTPRLQYRIPKTHGWQMKPGYDILIWLDGSMSFERHDCLNYYIEQLGDCEMGFFKHPSRRNLRQEVQHIEEHLKLEKSYITLRYKNGLHREFLDNILTESYPDKILYASTMFIYKNTKKVQDALIEWWTLGSRYFTCDQVQLPYILWKHKIKVKVFDEHIYKSGYLSLVSHHK